MTWFEVSGPVRSCRVSLRSDQLTIVRLEGQGRSDSGINRVDVDIADTLEGLEERLVADGSHCSCCFRRKSINFEDGETV
jgi:hypothetical protein